MSTLTSGRTSVYHYRQALPTGNVTTLKSISKGHVMSVTASTETNDQPTNDAVQSPETFALISQMFHAPVVLPFISIERFSTLTGFSRGVVDGWIKRGYLPVLTIGKYSAINLVQLHMKHGGIKQ